MSSQNSNNEFEGLDDPFGASGIASDGFEDMPVDSDQGVPEGEADNFSPAPEEGGVDFTEQPADGENPDAMLNSEEAPQDSEEEVVTVEYKKAPCWDLFSWLLLISWLTLLGAILFLWLECPSSEYGEPPYKESSVPVKTATP